MRREIRASGTYGPRIILNKERAGCGGAGQSIFLRRRSPGILYGIRVPTELAVSPDQDECVHDEAGDDEARTRVPFERVDDELFNPCIAASLRCILAAMRSTGYRAAFSQFRTTAAALR